jgi:RNA polymerase sigma-70 factor (ECF subfamily)
MKQTDLFLEELKNGNKQAFKTLYNKKYAVLCSYANRFIKDLDLCSDIVQDIFTKLWDNSSIIDTKSSIESYLFVCVKNSCFTHLKNAKKKGILEFDIPNDIEEDTDDSNMVKTILYEKMYSIIKDLPERSKQIMIMALSGESNSHISGELNISINTVRTIKQRVYSKIRSDFDLSDNNEIDLILFHVFYRLK